MAHSIWERADVVVRTGFELEGGADSSSFWVKSALTIKADYDTYEHGGYGCIVVATCTALSK